MLHILIHLEFTTKVMTHNSIDISMNFAFENYDTSMRLMNLDAPLNAYTTFIFQNTRQTIEDL